MSFLGRMSLELPALEKELDVVNKLFAIASDYNIHFHPEQMALYQTLSPSFQHLKVLRDFIFTAKQKCHEQNKKIYNEYSRHDFTKKESYSVFVIV